MLSKEDTVNIKGAAILMMVAYHLIGCPQKLAEPHPEWFGHPITQAGVLCLPIYVFLSGYGLQCGGAMDIRRLLSRLWKLYTAFWWIAVPFIGLGIAIGYYTMPSSDGIILGFLGLDYRYNDTWWFFSIYIGQLTGFLAIGRIKTTMCRYAILMAMIFVTTRVILKLDIEVFMLRMFLIYVNIFMLGCFFAIYDVFGTVNQHIHRIMKKLIRENIMMKLIYAAGGVTVALLLRAYFPVVGFAELIAVPLFVWSAYLASTAGGTIYHTMNLFGRHSTNIWLIHAFFIYYYLNGITFVTGNPLVMFLTVVCCSMLCSVCIEHIKGYAAIKKMKNVRAA